MGKINMNDKLLIELLEDEKTKAINSMFQLRHLKPEISPIEDIVKMDKEFSMHTYAMNCLLKLKNKIDNENIK
jgi:hypothetical protein